MAAILAAKSLDVQIIIAVDVVDSRLELAKAFGATHCINGKSPDVKEQIFAITVGNMLNFVVEATGVKACLKTAYDSLGIYGVHAQVGALGAGIDPPLDVSLNVMSSRSYLMVGSGSLI
jgi:aryl-alcohol dehydrogenase